MDNFIKSLPNHVLAALAIVVGIIVFILMSPPHTVCDTQEQTFRELQLGNIFPAIIKKNKIPPVLARAKEACQLGNSSGSCYEYFMALKRMVDQVANSASECIPRLYGISEVKTALNDGIELMVRLAWGVVPPDSPQERLGWMQESEVAIFCRLKRAFIRANGDEAWSDFRKRIFQKLPGEQGSIGADSVEVIEGKKALELMPEEDVWKRSLFSINCDNF